MPSSSIHNIPNGSVSIENTLHRGSGCQRRSASSDVLWRWTIGRRLSVACLWPYSSVCFAFPPVARLSQSEGQDTSAVVWGHWWNPCLLDRCGFEVALTVFNSRLFKQVCQMGFVAYYHFLSPSTGRDDKAVCFSGTPRKTAKYVQWNATTRWCDKPFGTVSVINPTHQPVVAAKIFLESGCAPRTCGAFSVISVGEKPRRRRRRHQTSSNVDVPLHCKGDYVGRLNRSPTLLKKKKPFTCY